MIDWIRTLFVSAGLYFAASPILAFEVKLDEWVFRSTDTTQLPMSIINPDDEPLAVQVKLYRRSFDIDGMEDYSEPFNDIVAFPENVIVMPKSEELVSLVWANPVMPKRKYHFAS